MFYTNKIVETEPDSGSPFLIKEDQPHIDNRLSLPLRQVTHHEESVEDEEQSSFENQQESQALTNEGIIKSYY